MAKDNQVSLRCSAWHCYCWPHGEECIANVFGQPNLARYLALKERPDGLPTFDYVYPYNAKDKTISAKLLILPHEKFCRADIGPEDIELCAACGQLEVRNKLHCIAGHLVPIV